MKTALAAGKAAGQHELHYNRVRCVDPDIQQTLSDPEHDDRGRVILEPPDKVTNKNCRQDDLKKRAARDTQELTEDSKDKMAGFVDGQIHKVKKAAPYR